MFHSTALFGSDINSYTSSKQSDMSTYTHIIHSTQTVLGQKKWNPRAKEIFPRAILDTRATGSPTLPYPMPGESTLRLSNSLSILFSRILLRLYVAHSFKVRYIENPMYSA